MSVLASLGEGAQGSAELCAVVVDAAVKSTAGVWCTCAFEGTLGEVRDPGTLCLGHHLGNITKRAITYRIVQNLTCLIGRGNETSCGVRKDIISSLVQGA